MHQSLKGNENGLSREQRGQLLTAMKVRFAKNMSRHEGLEWDKLWSVGEMDRTGGEPDVVGYDTKTDEYIVYDCSAESPDGRRNLCYDREALASRKANKPRDNAVDMAAAMGIEPLTEEQYRPLQRLGIFDAKTSSWVKTPSAIRELGGAIFSDRRFNAVFVYHHGAESYYAGRGFRAFAKSLVDAAPSCH
jgi:hypothetical protein